MLGRVTVSSNADAAYEERRNMGIISAKTKQIY